MRSVKQRTLAIFVVFSFAYWSTGLGQYLHEKLEHHHDEDEAASVPAKDGSKPLKEADDHDDCLICQTLKAMKAHPSPPPASPQPALPSVEIVPPPPPQAPVLAFVVFIPARAPPGAPAEDL
jgi:hypothetical protein